MHSLPTSVPATTSFILKHKQPTQLHRKHANINIHKIANVANACATNVGATATSNAHVDEDLLATVLRVHLETKLRRERARCQRKQHVTLKARVLQRAATALAEEPSVAQTLSPHKGHYGFRDAFHQLSQFQQH
jgi:hypothetical protein